MKIKKFSDFVFEAQFDKNKLRRVSRLFGILFGKKFGSTFQFFTLETYKKMGTKGMGIRLINDNAQMIRLNFNRDSISYGFGNQDRETLVIDGIDFWEQGNSDFGQPTLSCTFPKACNVVQIYKKLSLLLSQGKRGKFKYEDLKESKEKIQEAVRELGSKYDRQAFIDKKGADVDSKKTPFEEYLQANGLEQEYSDFLIEIKAGKPETNSTQENIQQVQADFDEHVYANPETVFKDIEDMTEFIAKGGSKALIVCGMGGIGKTYGIKQKLKQLLGDEGLKWTYHSGMKVSANAFYKTIYTERDRCVVLDEADSFLKNDEIVMMLKPALDTDGDHQLEYAIRTKPMNGLSNAEVRKYCDEVDAELAAGGSLIFSNSNKLADGEVIIPSKYFFDGQMIFISNMRAKQIDQALKSRALFIDVYLCAQDVFKRIGDIMQAKYPNMTREQIDAELEKLGANNAKQDNVVYMTPELARQHKQFSVRTATIGFALRDAGIANWSWLAQMYA